MLKKTCSAVVLAQYVVRTKTNNIDFNQKIVGANEKKD